MNPSIFKEYYMVNGTPVLMILTDARVGMQTWAADRASGEMKRNYALMDNIVEGQHEGEMSEIEFHKFCHANNITTDIPPASIRHSFIQAQRGQGLGNIPNAAHKYIAPLRFTHH